MIFLLTNTSHLIHVQNQLLFMASQPTPPKRTPLRNKGLIRPYLGKPMVNNKPLYNKALCLAGYVTGGGGGRLTRLAMNYGSLQVLFPFLNPLTRGEQ